METKEINYKGFKANGFLMFFLLLLFLGANVWLFLQGNWGMIAGIGLTIIWFILLIGFMKLEPNEASVMVFFGKYKGTFRETGFFWVNPFMTRKNYRCVPET